MALPTNLAAKLKSIPMDPTALATDLELAYLLSFAQHPITSESIYLYPRESYHSPLEHYQYAEFEDKTYEQLLEQTVKNYKSKNRQVARGIRCSFKEFYARIAANTSAMALKFMTRDKPQNDRSLQLPREDEEEYRIEKLKGNNPIKWPETTKQFVKDVNSLPWHAFSYDSELLFVDFVESAKNAIVHLCQKFKPTEGKLWSQQRQNLAFEIEGLLGVVLRTNNQSFILEQLKFISGIRKHTQLDNESEAFLCKRLQTIFDNFFASIPQESAQKLHSPGSLWDLDPFVIMKKIHFQKYAGLAYYSIATDGSYLYFYISAINGGMFKIGTGHQGTKAGKVYLEKQIHFPIGTKVDQVSWVYLKGKLYLKLSSRDAWFLDVINPETFEKIGNVQLFCPSLFGHPSLANINKNGPLLTDGQSLFVLGNRVKISKIAGSDNDPTEAKQKSPEKAADDKKSLLDKKKAMKKKAGKKGQEGENPNPPPEEPKNQNCKKILEVVLFEFQVDGQREYSDQGINENDVDELYNSFSGYFSRNQCRRGLALNNYDIAETCQWLFNEGEKEKDRNIKILDPASMVLLAENEITSNFQEKAIKAPNELVCKEGSVLMIQNTFESIWTMDTEHITCYSEHGLKVFSKDMKTLHKHKDTKLQTTLIQVLEAKFPRNPECNIIYDPYNYVFYTFGWPQEGHFFPTAVLLSKDRKNSAKLQEKKLELQIKGLKDLSQLQLFALHHMNLLDRTGIKSKHRFNDWLWSYGQKVLEIGNQMNQSQSDKKRLSNKRTKVLAKMNKLNELEKHYQKNKAAFSKNNNVIKEIVKIYPFQSEGTYKSYQLITDAFKDLPEHPEQIYLYVTCWENWLSNCSVIAQPEVKDVLLDLGQKLMLLKEKSTDKNRKLINKLLIQQFSLFFPTLEKQIKLITSMKSDELAEFVRSQWKHEKKEKESIVYELTKKELIVQKYETSKCDFAQIFKAQQNISLSQAGKSQLLGNLFLSDLLQVQKEKLVVKGKYDEASRRILLSYLQEQMLQGQAGRNLVQFLFLASLKMLRSNTKDSQLYCRYETELFVEVLRLFEKVFLKVKTSQLYTLLPTLLMIVEVYHGSLTSVEPRQQIITSLLKLTEYMQRPELNQIHNLVKDHEYEGVSPTTEKIYQTSHPLERGKNYNFPPRRFNNASLILLDLDKRCQSDPNNDNLCLQIIHEDQPVGNNIQINDGVFSSNIRLSGAVDTKKIHMLFSKSCTIDFTSSGHVKDTQSLVRYGFKFGLRPIFTGRNHFHDDKKEQIIKLFQNIHNFETYYNTLKFLAVATSSSIENYLQLENDSSEPEIEELLRSKIFKEGYEQCAFKEDYSQVDPVKTINRFISKADQEVDRNILKHSQLQYWSTQPSNNQVESVSSQELWNFQGIPSYIKTYLQQIKDFNGNFIDVFTEARQLAKEKGNYAQILRRKIVQQHKTLWLQGEAILFLTILKHSGLLHLNLKFSIEYIKENLKAFEDARDGIYNSFITRIQYVNEWRHLLETYTRKDEEDDVVEEEKKEEPQAKKTQTAPSKGIAVKRKGIPGRTIKITEKIEEKKDVQKKQKVEEKPQKKFMDRAKFEKEVRERLSNESLIKGICKIRKIKYDDQYDTVSRIIEEIVRAAEKPIDTEDKAYRDPIEHLIRGCLFLLKFKSPSTKESLSENEGIVPVGMMRSLSEGSRNCDSNKVNMFREWLENWKHWKGFKKEGEVHLQFPVQQIVKYINSWRNLKDIQDAISRRYLKCHNRIQFYTNLNQLFKLYSQNRLVKYVLGSQIISSSKGHSSDLQAINRAKIEELEEVYKIFKENIKTVEQNFINQLPLTLSKLEKAIKNGSNKFLDKMRLLLHSIFLLECENPEIDLNAILYIMSFKYLSTQHQDLSYVTNALVHRAFISKHTNEEIVECLQRQVGNSSISYKRWKDFFFVERVLFLLRKLELNLKQKVKIDARGQTKIAEAIFYMLYHIETPLIAKLGFKILKRLNISLKQGIKTAFDYEYKLYKANASSELELKETFKLQRNDRNNVTLLCSKISSIFDTDFKNQLALKFDEPKEIDEEEDRFNIILNLHQEEDLYWMLKALYYIDELQLKKGEKSIPQIKDFEDYLQLKSKKKEGEKKDNQKDSNDNEKDKNSFKQIQKNERIFNTMPKYTKVDPELEKELPVGWFFNYCDIFSEPLQKVDSLSIKKGKKGTNPAQNPQKNQKAKNNNQNNQNPAKKGWVTPLFTKLAKKYEEFSSKPPEEPKPDDSDDVKAEFVKAKNIFSRMKRYFGEILMMIDNFSRNGCYVLREDVSRARMNQLCQLITSGSMNKLKDIPVDLKNNDVKNRLVVNEVVPNFNSKLKITIIKNKDYAYFNNILAYQNNLLSKNDHHHSSYYPLLGRKQLAMEDSKAFMPYEHFLPFDESAEDQNDIEFGKQWIESNFSRMKKKYEKVYLNDYPNQTFYIAQGGIESGIRDNVLVPTDDPTLTQQIASFQKILTAPKSQNESEYEETELPEELVEKINTIIEKGSIEMSKKEHIREYLLLTFYLKKLTNFNLEYGDTAVYKELVKKLFKFTEHLHSYKELSVYQQECQKLIIKLIDNQHQQLHLFGTYIHDDEYDQEIEEYHIPVQFEKLNSRNQVKQESLKTHACIKSKYLLNSQPPQSELNKLLKYWEKNILPRIHQFVKTTLKPLEIEDFWEQMRRPLRVGDHTEAKRVAYIICDNKLPAGAVLPDSNHNWNSLEIEEIFVGENVLIKVPKSKGQFWTPLLGWGGHEHRLGKIVFVDVKSSSVLVRYRLEQLGIFSYSWVPINALMGVEKEVMHISTKSIYEELHKSIEGMVYIYAKECLTKLATLVSEVDNIKLIRETILDMFIKNPISGSFAFPKPEWSMRGVFEKMLEQGNHAILDMLEQQFCSIKGIDLNLNSEKMTELNRFDNAKALIVSFKKEAKLAPCSGVRFYDDKFGYKEIAHVYTAKDERGDLEPLEFKEPNLYCRYYSNKECLPVQLQYSYKVHPVEATIFAVDDLWTIGCYIGQVTCEIATSKGTPQYVDILRRLNTLFLKWLSKKSVSILCTHISKLISKITLTIVSICEKNKEEVSLKTLGTTAEQIKGFIDWINQLVEEESKDKIVLYSTLLQNISEMVASLLVKGTASVAPIPEHVKSSIDLLKIFKEIDSFSKTKKISLFPPNQNANYQWERILQVSNIPNYIPEHIVYQKIKQIIQSNKGKILCPKLDIFLKNGNCYILVDGWDINELIEEEVMEKMEQEVQEERQDQMNGGNMLMWNCQACTFQNPADVNMCQMCESPAPVAAKKQDQYDEVEATDLKEAERKVKEKEAKRFEDVKVQILQFFDEEYKKLSEKKDKKDNEQKQDKNKNKKGGKEEVPEAKEVLAKPQIKLQTGSSVFQKPEIDQFLKARLQYFPEELKGQVESENTYIGKFKKLLNMGYDLWGDNITNENATLIPFNFLYLLMDYVQTQMCKGSSSVLSYSEQSIRILSQIPLLDREEQEQPLNFTAENDMGVRVKYKALAGFKSYNIRYSWKFVKELNLAASKCLQLINMDFSFDKDRNDTCPVYNDCLGYKIKYYRNLIMGVIKLELNQKIMQKTSVSRQNDDVPKIILERLKSRQERARTGIVIPKEKEDHLFTKAHDQFQKISPAYLRPFKPKGTDPYVSFTVTFKGQNVMGQAGPYRQFFTDIGRQLDPGYSLGLFIPSPNNRHQSGEHKSKWIINPKANSTYHFSLFEFIGTLMGCCFRTGAHLSLDLPTMFWKSLTHEQITDADLEEVDSQLINFIKMLKECPSKEDFEEAMEYTADGQLTWTYKGFDDDTYEMFFNGKQQKVEYEDLPRYIDMLKIKIINETKLQVKRILHGLSQLIPLPYLHCLTGQELKMIICGRPRVDVDLLKKHTKYSGGLNEESRRIKFFWQLMHELPESERLKIIRFCWGQERLPINSEQFQRQNIRFMIKPMVANSHNQDQALPKADTCFFNIDLPDYSSKAIMREKILLAVNLDSVSINADQNIYNEENGLMNEINTYEDDYEEGEETW